MTSPVSGCGKALHPTEKEMTQMQPRLIPAKEVAHLVRLKLKQAFPGIRFSVRSNKGRTATSISVHWGLDETITQEQVHAVIGEYQSNRFDGICDATLHVTHWLAADGTLTVAYAEGSRGQRGSMDDEIGLPPMGKEAELVRLENGWIHGQAQ